MRAQIRLSDDEATALLNGSRTLHVATINTDGSVHLVPMWFAVVDGAPVFWTYTRSQKIKNLERDPRITVMVEAGEQYNELRGVQIRGRAKLSVDKDAVIDIGERLYTRYFGPLDEAAREGVAYSARKRTRVSVEAQKVVSWDHSRLGGGAQ
jgi:PPOX class probable F420-dependent enzyme